jgi:hypothetical protein
MVSLDHLIGPVEEGLWYGQHEHLGRLQVDYPLGLCGMLLGQILKLTK